MKINEAFRRFASRTSDIAGSSYAFFLAALVCVGWAVTGPVFGFSDTWQLWINTATNILTFMIVFLIQNTQNRDAKAIHLKLDELILSGKRASNEMINIEDLTDQQLSEIAEHYRKLREEIAEQAEDPICSPADSPAEESQKQEAAGA